MSNIEDGKSLKSKRRETKYNLDELVEGHKRFLASLTPEQLAQMKKEDDEWLNMEPIGAERFWLEEEQDFQEVQKK